MALRKLTRKSQFKFGKYSDCIVQNILDLNPEYVAWVYYHSSNINFFDDILQELGITDDLIIKKPSVSEDKWRDYKKICKKILYDTEQKIGMKRKNKYWNKKDKKTNELFRSIEINGQKDRFTHSVNTTK
tara:strand:- start:63 stop:452 length:390 start_codon:yes stop_codon:yes gene_type:complete